MARPVTGRHATEGATAESGGHRLAVRVRDRGSLGRRSARQPRRRALAPRRHRRAPRAARPGRPPSSRSTPAARTTAPTCSSAAFGDVLRAPGSTSFPAAVGLGLERLRERGGRREWVWILHDDANPDPGRARGAARRGRGRPRTPTSSAPSCASGPRCSGCSSSASRSPAPAGARPAWSAASTTRASTTRSARCSRSTPPACWCAARVLEELGGFDAQLPIFGNDIDFGWRAAAAGHRTLVVPAGGRLPRRGGAPRRSGVRR